MSFFKVTLLIGILIINASCSTRPTQINSQRESREKEVKKVAMMPGGLISGSWAGSTYCNAKKYPVSLNLKHMGNEHYSSILYIEGIRENRGSYKQLEEIPVTISVVDGEYRIKAKIFHPFLRTRLFTALDEYGDVSAIHFTTIQTCSSFQLTRIN